jgi:transcriptional regulator with XRE-family HTH domain
MTTETPGQELRTIREKAGLSLRQMSRRLGEHENNLQRYETGVRRVPTGLADRYRKAGLEWVIERGSEMLAEVAS